MNYFHNLGLYFEFIVSKYGNSTALKYKDKSLAYNELNGLVNQIANMLIKNKMQYNDVVAIFNNKEEYSYATMLACLKLGLIYTNIDVDNPSTRVESIFETAKPKLIISDGILSDNLNKSIDNSGTQLINFALNNCCLNDYDSENLNLTKTVISSSPAYIMFTSGSTGVPKGVTVSHANLLSFIGWSIEYYNITNIDIFAQISPMYFDNSVFDFYTAFFSGATIVPIQKIVLNNPIELVSYIDSMKCTIWFSVPSLLVYLTTMRVLKKQVLQCIRIFTFGGEGYPKTELKKLFNIYSHSAQIINVYGPTEGTCICSAYKISSIDFDDMKVLSPLGEINKNFNYFILDENMNKVQYMEKGELYLVGPNVALGYYNDFERTKEFFIQNPLQSNFKDMVYKTGDIVYEDQNHLLHFIGRGDNQVKHMGYRIELEEIEAKINSLEYVFECGVIYHRVKVNYGKIVAYISINNQLKIDEKDILYRLKKLLPTYMLPNIINFVYELPKNKNGKIDRKKLLQLSEEK